MLADAERPLILVGGSVWDSQSARALADWAEASGVPVATTFRRQDYMDNTHQAYVGYAGVAVDPALAGRIARADVVLALGTRLADASTGSYTLIEAPRPAQRLIHVYPDAAELGRVFEPELSIEADATAFVRELVRHPVQSRGAPWARELRDEYEAGLVPKEMPGELDMGHVVTHLRERLPPEAIITNGAGNFSVWAHRYHQFRQHGTQLAPTSGAMGYAVPAAVAAKLVRPEALVVAFAGDGDFMMSAQELATACQYDLALVILVINNGMFGTIRMHQEREYPGRVVGTDIVNPDFVALARSFGAHGELVERTHAFPAALERALGAGRAAVIELRVDPEALTPRATLSEVRRGRARARPRVTTDVGPEPHGGGYYFFLFFTLGGSVLVCASALSAQSEILASSLRHAADMVTYSFIGRSSGPKEPAPGSAASCSRSAVSRRTPTSGPNRPMNMFPLTNAARLPNIGFVSTPVASGTIDLKYVLSPSDGLGIFTFPSSAVVELRAQISPIIAGLSTHHAAIDSRLRSSRVACRRPSLRFRRTTTHGYSQVGRRW